MANIFDKYTENQLVSAFGVTAELAKKLKAESTRTGELQDSVNELNNPVAPQEEVIPQPQYADDDDDGSKMFDDMVQSHTSPP